MAVLSGGMEWRVFLKPDGVAVCDHEGIVYGPFARLVATPAPDGAPYGLALPSEDRFHGYRGGLEFNRAADGGAGLQAVNTVRLESYLRGVVADEMLSSAPQEALRSQAIAARTYALTDRYRFRSHGYDLTDTTASQMYGGLDAETAPTDEAVRSTTGMVVTRQGRMIVTDYCDDCGGTSAPLQVAPGQIGCVVDRPAGGGPEYCAQGTHHEWTLRVPAAEVAGRVGSASLGEVHDVRVTETDPSSRVARLRVEGSRGAREMAGEDFRRLFGYRRMRSTHFSVARSADGSFLFSGKGFGHGHGLCQWGAMGLASAPYRRTCRDILYHYYPGTRLADLRELFATRVARR